MAANRTSAEGIFRRDQGNPRRRLSLSGRGASCGRELGALGRHASSASLARLQRKDQPKIVLEYSALRIKVSRDRARQRGELCGVIGALFDQNGVESERRSGARQAAP